MPHARQLVLPHLVVLQAIHCRQLYALNFLKGSAPYFYRPKHCIHQGLDNCHRMHCHTIHAARMLKEVKHLRFWHHVPPDEQKLHQYQDPLPEQALR